ncbi:hypothetical protein WY02_05500 [Pseudonocardia sp. AL041005-10]|nr:hypothetical protein [Pseudonocardia sp. AL041005-10]ALE77978.1 hypothetical protein WY02_05500 [Pseudonocardia sp. AL041005-10]
MTTRRTVTDFAGIHIGTVDDEGRFFDYAGVHAGALGADLVVRDFEGIRIGRVAPGVRAASTATVSARLR